MDNVKNIAQHNEKDTIDLSNLDNYIWVLKQIKNKIESLWKEELKRILEREGQD